MNRLERGVYGKKNIGPLINVILFLIVSAVILVPVLFTAAEMGIFSPEPEVEIEIQETADDAPVLKIATDYDFCPNSYINSDGELSGLYIELMIEAANRLGVCPEFYTGTWLECRSMLTDKDVDVLLGLEIFSNMEGTLRTIPFCSDELRVYGKNKIDSAAALAGKRVALMARSVIETTYDLQCEYVEYYTNTDILEAAERGEVDYAIFHAAVATKIIEKNHMSLKPSLVISKSYPALAVQEDAAELRDRLNSVLQEMSLDGTIGRLQDKWITEFTKNKSLVYVLETNQIFYITFLLSMVILLCIVIMFRINYNRQERYIGKLLEYQERLKRSNEETNRANRAKSEFLSHMSHDIRTPINGIMGMLEIIHKRGDYPEWMNPYLDKIRLASGHLLSLISDVLDMSKIGSGSVELAEKAFDLDEELQKIHAIADVQAAEQGIEFRTHAEAVHRRLIGSPAHLRRIILNLVSNALKYNKPGGSVDVWVREIREQDGFAVLEWKVADTGIGMSQSFLENGLYKPFSQENSGARTEYQGTGLGMAIVNELVTKMQGTIQVESEQGKGTVFTVTIPQKINLSSEKKEENRTGMEKRPDIAGMRILVAEDNALNLEIIQFMLEDAGAVVTAVQNGKEAVEAVQMESSAFDAVLMDIMMPVMDGLEAARAIRSLDGSTAAVPIFAMTANAFEEDRKKTKEAGMNEHLTKPVNQELLLRTLAAYWKRN